MNSIGLFAAGLLLLLLGTDSAVRGLSGLSQRWGLSPFAAGMLMALLATAIPELAVTTYAVKQGFVDVALGNAVGSNIVNIGLTLAVAALVSPLVLQMRLLASTMVFALVATGAVLLLGSNGRITQGEGLLLLLGFPAFVWYVMANMRAESKAVQQEVEEYAVTATGLSQNLLRLVFAIVLLWFGSQWVIIHGVAIGQSMGFDPLVTGLTLVAVGTALPEALAVALVAWQGRSNVVVGQVLGACVFNMLVVVGGMAVYQPITMPSSLLGLEIPAAMAFLLVLYPILGGDRRISRREGGVLLVFFVLWQGFELAVSGH